MTHVVHVLDTVPKLTLFGSHHLLTQWRLLDNPTNSPHSMTSICDLRH